MSEIPYRRWLCDACGYIYDEAKGDPDSGLAPGTRYEDIPDDWECPLCGLRKSDLSLLPEQSVTPASKKLNIGNRSGKVNRGGEDTVVIIGAGIAGWSVAESIRRLDAEVPVLLVSACDAASYPKPALSTACALGKTADDLVEMDAQTRASSLGIDIRPDTRVMKIDTKKKRITSAKGGIQYGRLVLALGAHQRQLKIAGDAAESILRVNDLKSYRVMRKRLQEDVKQVTILGAGLIGCEFAEDLSSAGYQVTVVDPGKRPLSTLLTQHVAAKLAEKLEHKGVRWIFEATLDSLDRNHDNMRACLSTGEGFDTDLVISAAGLEANIALGQKSGLGVHRGIVTDRMMQTSVQDVYALGDCAEVEGRIFAYLEPIRRQAETIANNIVGDEQAAFEPKNPLIRIKTPSFPLSVCLPETENFDHVEKVQVNDHRTDFIANERLVGFVLSGNDTSGAGDMYRQVNQLSAS